ncbi:MAG: hypothetical protein ACOVNU_05990 [Candidatus Kapaibacteriota bacterium]
MRIYFIFVMLFPLNLISEDKCNDYFILGNGENIEAYGMDSTYHWWAVTKPFSDRYRMIIDDFESNSYVNLGFPVFSPNGEKWAFYAQDVNSIYLETSDTITQINCNEFGNIYFSGNSEIMAYSYKIDNLTNFVLGENIFKNLQNVNSNFYINYEGNSFAYTTNRNGLSAIILNQEEIGTFEQIKIIGFWNDGSIFYAGKLGEYWRVYRNKEVISENYLLISEMQVNLAGSFLVYNATLINGQKQVYFYFDELNNIQSSRLYQNISNLIIHPYLYLYGFRATNTTNELVAISNTEYASTLNASAPKFTFDGNEIYYIYCDNNCFLAVNGKNYRLKNQFDTQTSIVKKPFSESFAYSTNANLVVYDLETQIMYSGMMVDRIIAPRYNRFENRYETLGLINNRLYLLTCKF